MADPTLSVQTINGIFDTATGRLVGFSPKGVSDPSFVISQDKQAVSGLIPVSASVDSAGNLLSLADFSGKNLRVGRFAPGIDSLVTPGNVVLPVNRVPTRIAPVVSKNRPPADIITGSNSDGVRQLMTYHTDVLVDAVEAGDRIEITWSNWALKNGAENVSGSSLTILSATIEYPRGTFTPITFANGGLTSEVCASGGEVTGYATFAYKLPEGANLGFGAFVQFASGSTTFSVPYHTEGKNTQAATDYCTYGNTTTDRTYISGRIASTFNNYQFRPSRICAHTTRHVIGLVGDSRTFGAAETSGTLYDMNGHAGETERWCGKRFATINVGTPGDLVRDAVVAGAYVKRKALLTGATLFISDYGINDLLNSRTAAQIRADHATLADLIAPNLPFFLTTLSPRTTGAWTLVDGSDQTIFAGNAERVTYNNANRYGLPLSTTRQLDGYVEVADSTESSRDSGKWFANGTVAYATADGLHGSANILKVVEQSNGFSPLWKFI